MAVSLNKVVLEKRGDSYKVDLSKKIDQNIIINLNWNNNKGGFFSSLFNKNIDLDLGCYYELNNGVSSIIDGLQFANGRGGPKEQFTQQGCYVGAPWIWHCGDDRSGKNSDGENILINPQGIGYQPTDLKRIIVYCFIYDGVARWTDSDAIVTVKIPNNPEIVVEMGKQIDPRTFCVIASIEFDGTKIAVKKEITFHEGHADCDYSYNWGFNWSPGSK